MPEGVTHALCAQFVSGPHLAVSGKGGYGGFRGRFDPVFQVRFARAFQTAPRRLRRPALFDSGKTCPAKSRHAGGFGDIAEFGGQVEESGLVFDDVLMEAFLGGLRGLGARLMVS